MKLWHRLVAALFSAAALASGSALAQSYPTRPITLIVPWPAGGSTDTHLRKLGELASKHLGQPIIIENKPGFGGMLGPTAMAKSAAPDGYTLSQLTVGAFRTPHMQKVDSTGTGTSPHLLVEEVAAKAGVELLHVPFKGTADSTQALMGGHVMAQSDATGWGKFVDAGTFRLLVTFGDQRTRWGAPTAKELGYDVVSYSPYGIVGPKGMDPKIVKIVHDAFKKAIDDPENQKVLQQLDQVYWYRSTEDYAKWAAETNVTERALIERLGLLAK
jgi:tripartite-type tricarboxylate transporter receptor subunit TctC